LKFKGLGSQSYCPMDFYKRIDWSLLWDSILFARHRPLNFFITYTCSKLPARLRSALRGAFPKQNEGPNNGIHHACLMAMPVIPSLRQKSTIHACLARSLNNNTGPGTPSGSGEETKPRQSQGLVCWTIEFSITRHPESGPFRGQTACQRGELGPHRPPQSPPAWPRGARAPTPRSAGTLLLVERPERGERGKGLWEVKSTSD